MTEYEFLLQDRIAKIKSINEQYKLEDNAYIAFSGGKDSTVLHYLIDEALPKNKIPRVFMNTGIEYKAILKFVRELAEKDSRIVIWTVGKDIRKTLEAIGYPFKSKEHAQHLMEWKRGNRNESLKKYFRFSPTNYRPCPKKLMYQIEPEFTLPISNKCCYEFKKKPFKQYEKESGRKIAITGMLREEGGTRKNIGCIVTDKKTDSIKRFHPLAPLTESFNKWYIEAKSIKLCLYISRKRAAFTACAFKVIRRIIEFAQLDTLERLLPTEKKQCEYLWKPVYDEYRRIGYRLRKEEPSLFGGSYV